MYFLIPPNLGKILIFYDDNFISPEISNLTGIRNGIESHGQSAIGYVQVKRTRDLYYNLICAIYSTRTKNYLVLVI